MLILTRRLDDGGVVIFVAGIEVLVKVLGVERDRVKLGFDAPESVRILREELLPVKEMKRA